MTGWNWVWVLGVVLAALQARAQPEPSFAVEPSETAGAVGHAVTIYCTVANLGGYQVFWSVDAGQDFVLGPNTNIHSSYPRYQFAGDPSGGEFNLRIANLSQADAGNYTCLVRNPTGGGSLVQEARATLTVRPDPTSANAGYPTCERSPAEIVYRKGDALTLTCVSKGGVPLPSHSWVRVTEAGIVDNLNSVTTGIGDVVTTTAKIVLSSRDNEAYYKCAETHPARPGDDRDCMTPFSGSESRLDVLFAPEVDITPDVVSVHILGVTKVTLFCDAVGNPHPTALPEIVLPENKTGVYPNALDLSLVEVEFTPDDVGKTISCRASNSEGEGEDRVEVRRGPFPAWLTLVIIGGVALFLFLLIVVVACACCIDRSEQDEERGGREKDPSLLRVSAKDSTKRRSYRHEGEDDFLDDDMAPIDDFQGGQENLGARVDRADEPAGNSDFETGEKGPRYQNVKEVMKEANALDHTDDEPLAPYVPDPQEGEAEPVPVDLVE